MCKFDRKCPEIIECENLTGRTSNVYVFLKVILIISSSPYCNIKISY